MNATTKAIIARLPQHDILTPVDISIAYGMGSPNPILADIKVGRLSANAVNGRFLVHREEAIRYVTANEYVPDEADIEKAMKKQRKK